MTKYKIIFLIISSNEIPEFSQMRELTQKYMDLFQDDIKYYFLEYRENMEGEILEENNYLYFKGSDSIYASIYKKSIKAIEYISNKYDYDYVIRTNISTFWHIYNLFKFLEIMPKENFAGGYYTQFFYTNTKTIQFASGTGIIMSKDVGDIIYKNPNYVTGIDDVDISDSITVNGINIHNIVEYKWGYLIPPYTDSLPENYVFLTIEDDDFSNILYFRNRNEDRSIDVNNFKVLLKKLHGIII
jgi:hypothetical protein